MTETASQFAGTDVIDVMYRTIEDKDMTRFRTCFAPGATVWHAHDEIAQDIETVAHVLGMLGSVSSTISYQDRRMTLHGRQVFLQHTLTAELHNGDRLRLPAMMYAELDDDGRFSMIEEYYDSRAADVLAGPFAEAAAQ